MSGALAALTIVALAEHADEPFRVKDQRTRAAMEVALEGAAHVEALRAGDHVTYRDAIRRGDAR